MLKYQAQLIRLHYSWCQFNPSRKRFLHIPSSLLCVSDAKTKEIVSNDPKLSASINKLRTIDELIHYRTEQAKRTILVQTDAAATINNITTVCEEYGAINSIFQYMSPINQSMNVYMVEYKDPAATFLVHKTARMPPKPNQLSSTDFKQMSLLRSYSMIYTLPSDLAGEQKNTNNTKNKNANKLTLRSCKNIEEQINEIYKRTRLTEISLRRRFLTCYQIQQGLSGLYPDIQIIPFGSTINSFGTDGSDLDAAVVLGNEGIDVDMNLGNDENYLHHSVNGNVVYHQKEVKNAQKMLLSSIGDIIKLHIPHCSKVFKIMHARVPIVKFNQDVTGMGCDLSLQSKSGIYMSELLHVYGNADERVAKLVFAVRHWCKELKLNPSSDSQRISNFAITLMTLFYLMRTKPAPVIPTVAQLIKMSRPEDVRILPDGLNCTFLRDPSLLPTSENQQTVVELLQGFFEFYSKFNFKHTGICLLHADIIEKPHRSTATSLLIRNPQNPNLNVTANVTQGHVEDLKSQIRKALSVTSSFSKKKSTNEKDWGLLRLFSGRGQLGRIDLKHFFES